MGGYGMKQEDKDLLLKDLCSRLPYGVKIYLEDFPNATLVGVVNEGIILHCDKYDYMYDTPWNIEYVKPYLFPLSSMTDKQVDEYANLRQDIWDKLKDWKCAKLIDWFNKNHFDYHDLINKNMAIDCTNLNIY